MAVKMDRRRMSSFTFLSHLRIMILLYTSLFYITSYSIQPIPLINCFLAQQSDTELVINCAGSNATDADQMTQIQDILSKNHSSDLQLLKIWNSKIKNLPPRICELDKLGNLQLDDNELEDLPDGCFTRLRDLVYLSVERNRLKKLQDGLFDGLSKLQRISFKYNQIETIGLRLFSNYSDLPSLEEIELSHNYLTVLEPWPFIRGQAVNGAAIMISSNKISGFTNELGWNYSCVNEPFVVYVYLRGNNIAHLTDMLRGFNLTNEHFICMYRKSEKNEVTHIELGANRFNCDCEDYEAIETIKNYSQIFTALFDEVNCYQPDELYRMKMVTAMSKMEQFGCAVNDCPPNGFCRMTPANLTVYVYARNLVDLPLELPPLSSGKYRYRYRLDFSNNLIRKVTDRPYLANQTIWFDLSQSNVEVITEEAWMNILTVDKIFLHGNKLTVLPQLIKDSNHSFKTLSLNGNPLSCECQHKWMKYWLLSVKNRLDKSDSILCNTPNWLQGRVIFSVTDEEHCTDPNTSRLAAILSSVIFGALILLGFLFYFVVRVLRVHLFATFNIHPFDRDECEGEDMDYDVFLTCSHEDRHQAFIVLNLLEKNHCKVCYHEKDFRVGEAIADNICQAVTHSKRVLCLVSKAFLQSSYCVFEFETALNHNIRLKKKRVVVLLLEQIDVLGDDVPRELQEYLSSHTIVEYWCENWVKNLLYCMPTKRMMLNDREHANSELLIR